MGPTFSEISATTSTLVVPKLPDLDFHSDFKILKVFKYIKCFDVQLKDGNWIEVFEPDYPTAPRLDCPPDESDSKVYCRLGPATSLYTIGELMYLLNTIGGVAFSAAKYGEGDGYDMSEVSDLLQKGCWENVSTLQRFLERVRTMRRWKVAKCLGRVSLFYQRFREEKAKKRWRMVKCLGRISLFYQRFMEEYYAPPEGRGYLKSKCDFSDLMNSRFRAE